MCTSTSPFDCCLLIHWHTINPSCLLLTRWPFICSLPHQTHCWLITLNPNNHFNWTHQQTVNQQAITQHNEPQTFFIVTLFDLKLPRRLATSVQWELKGQMMTYQLTHCGQLLHLTWSGLPAMQWIRWWLCILVFYTIAAVSGYMHSHTNYIVWIIGPFIANPCCRCLCEGIYIHSDHIYMGKIKVNVNQWDICIFYTLLSRDWYTD